MSTEKFYSNYFLEYALVTALSDQDVRVALCGSGCALEDADQFISAATLDEIVVATGYSPGHGGSGRQALTMSFSVDNVDDQGVMDATNLTWTPATGATIHFALYHIAGTTGDTDARFIGRVGIGGVTGQVTDGNTIEMIFSAEGVGYFGRAEGS